MADNKNYAVFGLGRYGRAVATELTQSGAEVLAVDMNEAIVNEASQFLPYCKCADITDIEVLRQLGIADIDTVVIAMGTNLESSVMAIMLCKELGVRMVIAKCSSEMHKKILEKVGADKTFFPEYESGVRLAKNIMSKGFVDLADIDSDFSLMELDVKPEWVGKSLLDLNIRKKHSANVVAISENGKTSVDFDPSAPLKETMKLIVVANHDALKKLK